MISFKFCKHCNKVTEMDKKVEYSHGYENIYYTCIECKKTDKEQINKVHYGNDGIR